MTANFSDYQRISGHLVIYNLLIFCKNETLAQILRDKVGVTKIPVFKNIAYRNQAWKFRTALALTSHAWPAYYITPNGKEMDDMTIKSVINIYRFWIPYPLRSEYL